MRIVEARFQTRTLRAGLDGSIRLASRWLAQVLATFTLWP